MKRGLLLLLSMLIGIGAFAQAKYQAKVIVLFMGEKNLTFDESKFPDFDFYYTPGITAEVKKLETVSNKLLASAGIQKEGIGYNITFSGAPTEAYLINSSGGIFLDRNGVITARYKSFDNILMSPKRNMQGTYDFARYDVVSKDYIKKGKTTKMAKKAPKKPKQLFDYHRLEMPKDFEVEDASGNIFSIKSLVKGEPLTLLYTMYLDPDYDLNAGLKSGANKSGKEYINDVLDTQAGIEKLQTLVILEQSIFGYRVTWSSEPNN